MKNYKNTGGTFRIGKKIIKQNEVFLMPDDWSIPQAFEDAIFEIGSVTKTRSRKQSNEIELPETGVNEILENEVVKPVDSKTDLYFKQEREASPGWWDVIATADGNAVNEKGLRENDADELVSTLSE